MFIYSWFYYDLGLPLRKSVFHDVTRQTERISTDTCRPLWIIRTHMDKWKSLIKIKCMSSIIIVHVQICSAFFSGAGRWVVSYPLLFCTYACCNRDSTSFYVRWQLVDEKITVWPEISLRLFWYLYFIYYVHNIQYLNHLCIYL